MGYKRGHGGSMTVNGNALPTIDADIKGTNRVGETTNSSGTTPDATYIGTVTERDFRCTVVWDDEELLESSSIEEGALLPVSGKLGNSSKTYSGSAVMETVRYFWNNRQGVVEAEVTGKFSGAVNKPS